MSTLFFEQDTDSKDCSGTSYVYVEQTTIVSTVTVSDPDKKSSDRAVQPTESLPDPPKNESGKSDSK